MQTFKYRRPERRDTKIIGVCRICTEKMNRYEHGDIMDMPKQLIAEHETHIKVHKSCFRKQYKSGLLNRKGERTKRQVHPDYPVFK